MSDNDKKDFPHDEANQKQEASPNDAKDPKDSKNEAPTGHKEAEKDLGMNYYADEKLGVEHERDDRLGISIPKEPWTSKIRLVGIIVIVIFFGGFAMWSYLVPIESAAIAPGKVTVAGNRRTIQHLEGGIIKNIYVKDGTKIKEGEILVKLDDTQPEIILQLAQNEVYELLAIESRLSSERDKLGRIVFADRLLEQASNPKVARLMQAQNSIFKANKETFEGNVKILQQRIIQLQEQIKGTQAQLTSNTDQYKLIQEEVVSVAALEKKKLIERPKLLELQREMARLAGLRGQNLSEMSTLQQKIGETQAQILTIASTQLKETLTELRDTGQKLHEQLEKERSATDVLTRTSVRSPQDGEVVGLKFHTVGGVIKPGDSIMDIVPSRDKLVIEVRINPLDINVVHRGLLARVQLTAFKQRTTPSLAGKVEDVSADIFQDQQSNQSYYTARVSIDPKELLKLKGQVLYPGMPAQVMIITEKRTPLQYFFLPIKQSFSRAFREQ